MIKYINCLIGLFVCVFLSCSFSTEDDIRKEFRQNQEFLDELVGYIIQLDDFHVNGVVFVDCIIKEPTVGERCDSNITNTLHRIGIVSCWVSFYNNKVYKVEFFKRTFGVQESIYTYEKNHTVFRVSQNERFSIIPLNKDWYYSEQKNE